MGQDKSNRQNTSTKIKMVVVFKCALTGHEISSDAYKIEETEFFKIIYGKLIEEVEEDFDIGANASEGGAEEGDGVEKFKKTYPRLLGVLVLGLGGGAAGGTT